MTVRANNGQVAEKGASGSRARRKWQDVMNLTIALAEGTVGTLEVEVASLTPERSSNPHDLFDLSSAKVAVAFARVVNHEAPPPFLGAR